MSSQRILDYLFQMLVLVYMCTIYQSSAASIATRPSENDMDVEFAWGFLKEFGYADEDETDGSPSDLKTKERFHEDIKKFQEFYDLQQTGELDAPTLELMHKPRCGVKDIDPTGSTRHPRGKRYVVGPKKWENQHDVTYRMGQYSEKVGRKETDNMLEDTLKRWADVADIQFRKVSANLLLDDVDIDVSFVTRAHGDKDFDGKGHVLAHAFYPASRKPNGDVHIDEEENWTIGTGEGDDLFSTVIHEIGHAIGLAHSTKYASVMYAYTKDYQPNLQLDVDDIQGAQEIYGSNPNWSPRTTTSKPRTSKPTQASKITTTTSSPGDPHLQCILQHDVLDGRIDAITMSDQGTVMIFRKDAYIELELDPSGTLRLSHGFPMSTSQRFTGLPSNLDAALSYPASVRFRYNRTTSGYDRIVDEEEQFYFFKGSNVYHYYGKNSTLTQGYPKTIANVPENINAAFRWSGNGNTYFIKGDQYYLYNRGTYKQRPSLAHGSVAPGYPKFMSEWPGLTSKVDAAFQLSNGRTYFFSDDVYYRFNDVEGRVDHGYPKSTKEMWYGC